MFQPRIVADEQEAYRHQIEHNLAQDNLSLHLSSSESGVEYPRHDSGHQFDGFRSMEQLSRDHFDMEGHSQMHNWSYRDETEHGINPYAGESMSTAAHHASALTFSAGLGGRGSRREMSFSGAEYDPDRPLNDMIQAADSKLSMFDADPSKSRYQSAAEFDPLVVDSTAELDRILQSGQGSQARHFRSGLSRSSTSSASESESSCPRSPRPKLSDALHGVNFSPKRPRSVQAHRSTSIPAHPQAAYTHPSRSHSQLSDHHIPRNTSETRATPQKRNPFPTQLQQRNAPPPTPDVRVQPPTPVTAGFKIGEQSAGSEFTRKAQGLARDIHHAADASEPVEYEDSYHPAGEPEEEGSDYEGRSRYEEQASLQQSTPGRPAPRERNPFMHDDGPTPRRQPSSMKGAPGSAMKATRGKVSFPPDAPMVSGRSRTVGRTADVSRDASGRIHLPDITGLTNAVETPIKGGLGHYNYPDTGSGRKIEAQLLAQIKELELRMSQLESQLKHAQDEHGISRRRVRELEMELEACKAEVKMERTRLEEKDKLIQQLATGHRSRANTSEEIQEIQERYREVVADKKSLEGLIKDLRTHLTRLTTELAGQQSLFLDLQTQFMEFRTQRDADLHSRESDMAQREANLRKRETDDRRRDADIRALLQKTREFDQLKDELQRLSGELEQLRGVTEDGLEERKRTRASNEESRSMRGHYRAEEEEEEANQTSGDETQEQDQPSQHFEKEEEEEEQAPFSPPRAGDRTQRTDHATLGSSGAQQDMTGASFISREEIERISVELEERRSDRSASMRTSQSSQSRASGSRSQDRSALRPADASLPEPRSPSPLRKQPPPKMRPTSGFNAQSSPRPFGKASTSRAPVARPEAAEPATPFPQIRGGNLERLFFSAPEHNAKTCKACHRKQRPEAAEAVPSWMPGLNQKHVHDDEGFVEGDDVKGKGKQREQASRKSAYAQREGLPPQTVLSKVLREIEDDFTHYKGIYIDLAEQYAIMDAISNVAKRNLLAEHLREVIEILEQKGDQIASLHDLLKSEDRPAEQASSKPGPEVSSWAKHRGLQPRS